MQKHRIRLSSTDSVSSVNKDNKVTVDLQQTTKPLIFTSLKDEVNQYEIFKQERDNCVQYRLIITINPYCTNILFNPVTEIVKDEGDDESEIITDVSIAKDTDGCYGIKNPKRFDMIRNTEYSRESIGYKYHPGTDIFNNHILRNTSFKIVNPLNKTDNESRRIFNTIEDLLRNYNSETIQFKNRTSLNDRNTTSKPKHLYDYQDILNITDSINNNLMEDNGWFGFVNKSSIISKQKDGKEDNDRIKWVDEDFNHVINNKESCEFIDLYPDRTLFSFNPKYNSFKHRPEYNWHLCLTYPYENFYNHNLIKDTDKNNGFINALLINNLSYITGINGESIIMLNTLTKHNLKSGDVINFYYKKEGEYIKIEQIRVSNIGDIDKNNKEHYFYTTDLKILTEIGFTDTEIYEGDKNFITESLKDYIFRFKHLVNGSESEYYIRIFHKLPNLLKKQDKLTKEIANDVVVNQGTDFDKEQYQLAFASTIYNDNKTQATFTDGINIENLLDNRGRPVSEIFLTIIKNNNGNKNWYDGNTKDVEYSHCFSELSCGFDLFFNDFNTNAENSDVKTLNNVNYNGESDNFDYVGKFGWQNWNIEEDGDLMNITYEDNMFIGDLVEFNITNCNEIVLEDCHFRFNTYIREHGNELNTKYSYNYDEIVSDDYDKNDFSVKTYTDTTNLTHPEGYFYKPHYRIQLKEYGKLNQASHFDLKIKKMYLSSINDNAVLFIQTTLPHRLMSNDVVLFCDDEKDRILKTNVIQIKDNNTFAISNIGQLSCENLYNILNGKYESIKFKLRRYNTEIPFYAEKFKNLNRYMWRDINTVGNKDNTSLPEYPFANGYFYINQDINFYLKRQDPFNEVGLYYDGNDGLLPNDIFGNVLTPSNYEYKEETEVTC